MKIAMRWVALVVAVVGLVSFFEDRAGAAFVTYTESVTASGTLNGVAYSNALVTLTATGDTGAIGTSFGTPGNPVTVTFTVAGSGGGTLTGSYFVFDSQSTSGAGIELGTLASPSIDVLDTDNAVFATYGLAASIGPVSGTGAFNPLAAFSSSSGGFLINMLSSNVNFTAVVTPSAVPEPSSLALCGIAGAIGLAVARVRRKRA